ncbi:hypothetical protein GCM10009087_40300 [Sphingomonas oligophenolica]|uniref:Formyltransferase family protein n=1 Tax=Sphingomonas oligophenolica TaxID=301154 RepID=A0ABU9Y239_9SPHN
MKIAYFGFDFFVEALDAILGDGHNLVHVQTFDVDGKFINRNGQLVGLAEREGSPIAYGPVGVSILEGLRSAGCDVVLVMGFPFKIPVIEGLRMVNLHPTLLPQGRGPFPIPWLILHHPEYSGLTLHKVTEEMDRGAILVQSAVPVTELEALDSLCAKLQMKAVEILPTALRNFDDLWKNAADQGPGGTYWKASEADWQLPWEKGWSAVVRTARAFGAFESEAIIDGKAWSVTDATGWDAEHSFPPGFLVHRMAGDLVVAARDGFVLLRNPTCE